MILGANRLRFDIVADALEQRRPLVVALLCLLWLLPGLIGHQPWKPDEAYVLGVVHRMLLSGDLVVPGLAGEPFLRHPPFYYAAAALAGRLFSPLLALHDAARLVNLLFGTATLVLVGATVRILHGAGRGWLGPLLLVGCVGMLQPAHLLSPDNALLTAFALAIFGLALVPARAWIGGIAVGTAIGLAFLSRGLLGAVALVVASLALPLFCRPYRTLATARALFVALLAAGPWLVVWPVLLYLRDPRLLHEWISIHELGRYRFDLPGAGHGTFVYYLEVLPWFAWPVFPFALWALWTGRHEFRNRAAIAVPAALLVAMLALLSTSHDKRELFALPLLVPLTVLAAGVVPTLRRGTLNAFFWFGIAFFLFFLPVIWFYWVAVEFGVPARLASHMARMEPGYVPSVGFGAMAFAAALTAGWLVALFNIRRSNERPFLAWSVGATAFWGVLTSLMMGFIDNAKSYRAMELSLAKALPAERRCVTSLALGESQRALLHYYLGLETLRIENGIRADRCDYLLVEGSRTYGLMQVPWKLVWEGHRAGDNRERFRLYRHAPNTEQQP